MYRIEAYSAVKKDIKKLDRKLQKEVKEKYFADIERNPYEAEPLAYEFK